MPDGARIDTACADVFQITEELGVQQVTEGPGEPVFFMSPVVEDRRQAGELIGPVIQELVAPFRRPATLLPEAEAR